MNERTSSRRTLSRRELWQTPALDDQQLIDPPEHDWLAWAEDNRGQAQQASLELTTSSLDALTQQARSELLTAALQYTGGYRSVPNWTTNQQPLFLLTGHQPELFHPGVWLKNSILARVQRLTKRPVVAINLVIDSDLVKSSSVAVPAGTISEPRWAQIDLDGGPSHLPWQFRKVHDFTALASWPSRLLATALPIANEGSWHEYWPRLLDRARTTQNLGLAIAQARHQMEADWDWQTLELPLSQVCELPSVQQFLSSLIDELPRFQQCYNQAIREYRIEYQVTSNAHPAPQLATNDDWIEAPLWSFSHHDPTRRRVWARRLNGHIELRNHAQLHCSWSMGNTTSALDAWSAIAREGICLRPKALLTTLLARMLLSDLFLHGIGGAKYDQVTDRIIKLFWSTRPPEYAVVTGTMRWPYERPRTIASRSDLLQQLRATIYHPEVWLADSQDPGVQALIEAKRACLAEPKTPANAAQRHRTVQAMNQQLSCYLTTQQESIRHELATLSVAERGLAILNSRELAFPLHSTARLKAFLERENLLDGPGGNK